MKNASLRFPQPLAIGAAVALSLFFIDTVATAAPTDLFSSGSTWYRRGTGFASGANNGVVVDGTLLYQPTNAEGEMLSYFAPQGSPVALEVGQQITLNFTYSISDPVSGAGLFRIGLFDSNDVTRVSTNNFTAAAANGYTGYFITTGPTSTASTTSRLYMRGDSNAGNLISGTGGNFPSTGDAGGYITAGAGYGLKNNTTYSGFLQIAYVSVDAVRITYSFNDAADSITFLDDASRYTSFDTVGIQFGRVGSDVTQLHMTNLSYEISQIPEPATTVSVLTGLLVFGAAVTARRRRRSVTIG